MVRRGGRLLACLASCVVAASACGVEAGTSYEAQEALQQERERRAEVLETTREQSEELGIRGSMEGFTDDEVRCVEARAREEDLDVEALVFEGGDAAVAILDVVLGCIDAPGEHEGLIRLVKAGMEGGGMPDLTDEEVGCLLEEVVERSDDPARTIGAMSQQEDLDLVLDAAERCFRAETYAEMSGAEGTGPQAYGDDERFDRMYDDCEAGDDRVCDLLYLQVSTGSDYEELAASCAGRSPEADTYCSADVATDEEGFADPDAPGTRALEQDCRDGDLTACDLLYRIAPLGSDLEDLGYTCGGQLPVGALPDCRTRLGD